MQSVFNLTIKFSSIIISFMKKYFLVGCICLITTHNLHALTLFTKSYSNNIYSYDLDTGNIIRNKKSKKLTYNIGLILDSGISNPPTTGLLYKTIYLSKEMVKRGHSYTFFICNRNFTSQEQLNAFKLEGIKIHILEEKLFYDIEYMAQLVKSNNLDIIQYEIPQTYLDIGVRIKKATGMPSVLVLHDIEDELMSSLGKTENNQILDFVHYTASHLADAIITLTATDQERRIQRHGIPQDKIFITPIGINKELPFKGANTKEKIIGLVGNQFYEPNRRASIFLIEKVLPLVQQKYPEAKVKIIGMCPYDLKSSYENRLDVIFTGEITNQQDYINTLASLTLGTCCVDSGCGMNVKISNYCSLGLPVILTPICYTGYENITSLILVDLYPKKIAEAINNILSNPSYAKKLGKQNHELIHKWLSWSQISLNLEEALNYAYSSRKATDSDLVRVKPVWLSEKRHNIDILEGHHIIEK